MVSFHCTASAVNDRAPSPVPLVSPQFPNASTRNVQYAGKPIKKTGLSAAVAKK